MGNFVGKFFLNIILPIVYFVVAVALFALLIKAFTGENKFRRHMNEETPIIDNAMRRSGAISALS